ncbi:MAG TPA: hypothetical protein VFO79_07370 [Xanthomonadales bacterium]|nr:hypothetical protein [Xanthomonadales bacterium]
MSFPPPNEPAAARTPPPTDAAPDVAPVPGAAAETAPESVPPAPVEIPTAVEELLAFGRAIAQSASAELSLSTASFVRATIHGIAAIGAVVLAWIAAMVALTLFLVHWLGSTTAFSVLALAHLALAGFAWKRHLLWQKRIGFARTRAAIATVAGLREPPP